MDLHGKLKDIICSYSNTKIKNEVFALKSNFPLSKKIPLNEDNFQDVYSDVFNIMSITMNQYFNDREKNKDFNPSNYGLPFMEKINGDTTTLSIEMLFEYRSNDAKEVYGHKFRASFVKILQEVINSCFIIENDEPKEMICYVLKTDIWFDNNSEKQRLKFVFPGIKVNKSIVNTKIIPILIDELNDKQIIRLLYKQPLKSWKDIIQPVSDFSLMYGCKYEKIEAPLFLDCIYENEISYELDDLSEEDKDDLELLSSLCIDESYKFEIRDSYYFKSGYLDEQILDDQFGKHPQLAILSSVNYQMSFTKYNNDILRLNIEPPKSENRKQERELICTKFDGRTIFDEIVSMIDKKERFTKEKIYYWYTFGKCCYGIFNGSQVGKEKFIQNSPSFFKEKIDKFWRKIDSGFYDIRTLMDYARQDNEEQFNEWLKNCCKPLIDNCVINKGKDMPMSDLSHRIFCLDYIYDRKEDLWYKRKGAFLSEDIGALELKEDLRFTLKQIFYEVQFEREAQRDNAQGTEERKIHAARVKDVEKIVQSLEEGLNLDRIIKSLKGKMFDDSFTKNKDENLDIMSCTNVVLEVYDKKICYRPFSIQDYTTKCTNIPFPISYDMNHEKVKYLLKYYSQVHTDKEMCNFFLKDMASYLKGGNDEKIFRNFIGERNASKSKVIELLQKALGDYCVDFPSETIIVTKGKTDGGPDPGQEQGKGARVAIVGETSGAVPLDAAKIKKKTTNDRYWCRGLHKAGSSRLMSYKLIHMSNVIAPVVGADPAYRSREYIYPFMSTFEIHAPTNEEDQYRYRRFPMDERFSEKIKYLGQAQLFLMYSYFPIYMKEGLKKLPKIVKEVTRKHHREIDPFYSFLKGIERHYQFPDEKTENKLRKKKKDADEYESDYDDEIHSDNEEQYHEKEKRRTELSNYLDESKKITESQLFNHYTRWYQKFFPDSQMYITQSEFRKEMEKPDRMGPSRKGVWYGASIKGESSRR